MFLPCRLSLKNSQKSLFKAQKPCINRVKSPVKPGLPSEERGLFSHIMRFLLVCVSLLCASLGALRCEAVDMEGTLLVCVIVVGWALCCMVLA